MAAEPAHQPPAAAAATERVPHGAPRDLRLRCWREWFAPRWKALAVSMVLAGLVGAATSLYPLTIKYAFDFIGSGTWLTVALLVAAIIGGTALRGGLLYLQTVLSQKIVLDITTGVQKVAFGHLLHADYARLSRGSPGEYVSRLTNDIAYLQGAASTIIASSIRDVLTVIALVATMFWLDWVMSLVVLLIYPLAAWPIIRVGERLRKVAKRTQVELGTMTASLAESLRHAADQDLSAGKSRRHPHQRPVRRDFAAADESRTGARQP